MARLSERTLGTLYDSLALVFGFELRYKLPGGGMNTDGTGREEGGTEGEEVADGTEQDGPYEDVEMLPCEFCNDVFAFHELTAHQAVCAGNIRHRFQAILATQEMRTDERLAAGFNRIREGCRGSTSCCFSRCRWHW